MLRVVPGARHTEALRRPVRRIRTNRARPIAPGCVTRIVSSVPTGSSNEKSARDRPSGYERLTVRQRGLQKIFTCPPAGMSRERDPAAADGDRGADDRRGGHRSGSGRRRQRRGQSAWVSRGRRRRHDLRLAAREPVDRIGVGDVEAVTAVDVLGQAVGGLDQVVARAGGERVHLVVAGEPVGEARADHVLERDRVLAGLARAAVRAGLRGEVDDDARVAVGLVVADPVAPAPAVDVVVLRPGASRCRRPRRRRSRPRRRRRSACRRPRRRTGSRRRRRRSRCRRRSRR